MKTIEKIVAIRDRNPAATTADVAAEIGVSKQRVSALCSKHEVKLRPAYRRGGRITPPKPRLITGGAPVALGSAPCGTISELLAAADLIARGYKVYSPFVRQRSHDLIAVAPDGTILTFEVRGGHRTASGALSWSTRDRGRSHHFAIVVTGEPVAYSPALP